MRRSTTGHKGAAREPAPASGARYPVKGGGLVRAGEQGEPERVFWFMSAHRAVQMVKRYVYLSESHLKELVERVNDKILPAQL
jgi:hypothetical protein